MSRRFFGQLPAQLATILNTDGQKVQVDHVNDQDGIHLVYDIGQLVQGQFLEMAHRGGSITLNGGQQQTLTITDLPLTYCILNIQVSADQIALLNVVDVTLLGWGATGPTGGTDHLVFHWVAGGTTIARPFGSETVQTQALILVPSFSRPMPIMQRNAGGGSNSNQHVRGVMLSAQGAGAAVNVVHCSLGIAFWSAPVGTPRSLTILPAW